MVSGSQKKPWTKRAILINVLFCCREFQVLEVSQVLMVYEAQRWPDYTSEMTQWQLCFMQCLTVSHRCCYWTGSPGRKRSCRCRRCQRFTWRRWPCWRARINRSPGNTSQRKTQHWHFLLRQSCNCAPVVGGLPPRVWLDLLELRDQRENWDLWYEDTFYHFFTEWVL